MRTRFTARRIAPLFVALLLSFTGMGCGSNGNGHDPAPPPSKKDGPEKPGQTSKAIRESNTTNATADDAASGSRFQVPRYSDEPTLLVEIDKWGAHVSGGTWFKAQPEAVRKEHASAFKAEAVSAFRRLSPLKATGRTLGRSLYYPALEGISKALNKRAQIVGDQQPVPVELRVRSGVPFWLVTHFVNVLLWNDQISHLQVAAAAKRPPLLIARSLRPTLASEPTCAQQHVLLRGERALAFWEPALADGQVPPQDVAERPAWAGAPSTCKPWSKVDASLFSSPPPDAAGLPACAIVRVDALDSSLDWDAAAPRLAQALPDQRAILLGNVNRPDDCPN